LVTLRIFPAFHCAYLRVLLICAALLPLLACAPEPPSASLATPQVLSLHAAHAAPALAPASQQDSYPATSESMLVSLPDEWARTRPGFAGTLWYRTSFTAPAGLAQDDMLALYVERVCSHAEFHLNGKLLHATVSLANNSKDSSNSCNHPQLISLPAALLLPEENIVDIKVSGYGLAESASRLRAGALSPLLLGPLADLSAHHGRQTALQVAAPQAVSATLALMGSFMFVLGFMNRRDSHLAYFGALSLGWAVLSARSWLTQLPLGHVGVEFLSCAILGFVCWAAVQFLLRYCGTRLQLADVGLPLQCAVLTLSLLVAGPQRLNALANFWYAVLALQVALAAWWYLRHQAPGRAAWFMPVLLAVVFVGIVTEVAVQTAYLAPWASHAVALVLPVTFVLVGLRLVQQHGQALQHAELDNAVLEQRVAEAKAQIENTFRQMAELRVEQVTERERKRIAGDLHDDLGAKLLTIVHTSESERISTLAREALEEMRLSVRGLTGKPVRLADALGDWRAEVISRLAQAGVEAEWVAPEDLPHTLSARAYVQTTRILREATSNIIKHSGASNCSVSAGISDGDFQLVVQDDGDGISSDIERRMDRGHGLAGMKNRAKQLNGQCLVESGPGFGTVIRLTIPLGSVTEAS
jgi:two-component system, NarL family, sensor histidine kinase UhpB